MNLQTHMSGQFSGQVPNQQNMMQNSGVQRSILNMEPGLVKARRFIQERIYDFLMRRNQSQAIAIKKVLNIVKRLEEGLFKTATSQEEYLNLETLEARLHVLIKRLPLNNNPNQQYQQPGNASVAAGTMIPTPGVSHSGNSSLNIPSSMDQSFVSANGGNTIGNTGNFIPNTTGGIHNGSFNSSDGGLTNGYQESAANYSASSVGNSLISSMGAQRMASQMIPTPGLNINNNGNSSSNHMNIDTSNSVVGISGVDSTMVSQPMQQKQQVGGQNSRILHSLGSHMGGGIRSSLHQKSYGFQNGSLNGGVGMVNNNMQMINGSGTTEGYLNYGNTPKQLPQHFDPHQRQMSHGDAYGSGTLDSSGSGNLYGPTASGSSMMNNQNMNSNTQQPLHYQQHGQNQQNQQSEQNQQLSYAQSQLISDSGRQIKSEPGIELQNEQFQSSMSANNNQSQDMFLPMTETSHQYVVDSQNDIALQPEGQWKSNMSYHLNIVQGEPHQRITGNRLSSKGPTIYQNPANANTTVNPPNPITPCLNRELQYRNQQRWLLFMRHARKCVHPDGKCPESNCSTAQKLWNHMISCKDVVQCKYPRCRGTKRLLHHHRNCRDQNCPVCVPVKRFVAVQLKGGDAGNRYTKKTSPSIVETLEDLHPSIKKMKIEQQPESDPQPQLQLRPQPQSQPRLQPHSQPQLQLRSQKQSQSQLQLQPQSLATKLEDPNLSGVLQDPHVERVKEHQVGEPFVSVKSEITGYSNISDVKQDYIEDLIIQESTTSSMVVSKEVSGFRKELMKTEKEVVEAKPEIAVPPAETSTGTKSGKPKIKGVSMIELFTPEQVEEHITGLRQWVGQSKAKAEKNQAMENLMTENACRLCAVEKLSFEPPPIYCTPCGARIKRNALFYTAEARGTHHCFCSVCHNEIRGDSINVDGTNVFKAKMEKKKNDEETEEWWVQCDKCEAWQHQVCALFNGRRNDGGQAEYTCPNCYVGEVKRGERIPLPQSAVLGAKDLPRTILSDYIENRLYKNLKRERMERARVHGKSYDEVPGAESLVVRVVSSVDKKLEVKERFLEIFQEENYPKEFGYKSKVVLLFQKIEGVEVCLFGMYVQEFGAECEQPNHRRVYLSYLDSVKYFRPEIRTVTGEALRTFVYHEILIGYLEYCKLRGFTSCYIWACPPLKGEDYILYCHPEIQKTPNSNKLREWYLAMLKKATKEKIVVELTNLYDHFFTSSGDCKAKVTAARLPYFDGDYWPGAAEDIIYQIRQEEEGKKQNKRGPIKKTITKRALKASGQLDLSGNVSKDLVLMHRLGEMILPMKEDFIMVHLQPACTHCCLLMVSGTHWVCNQCKNFQLCERCYELEQTREERERHPVNHRDKHPLYPVEMNDVPADTKDKDQILESEFFDTRQAFLSLCQGNHYQYDTLRRAKHSSMMVLYHLHNPTAPAFVTTCNKCHLDIETGQGWRCETCPEYDVCNSCYYKDGGIGHPHKLTNHPSAAERDAQNQEARQLRVAQLRKMLDLLVHASQCPSPLCQYPNCRKVKGLFRHGIHCKVRASGGCVLCKKMWHLLQLHARACKESKCHVPRCRDLNEHLRRMQQQSDSRRRAAVMEMMRQRATEVASST
uniref:histone acetyltransferase n=1 Tax=Tanacetum cinerariifolium TaxID=118510 RepID=A0A6L2MWJ9_TANCI|nr:histone acetyltransferase HAC1-like isoform X1 [Tanacetum cinerariifolium]